MMKSNLRCGYCEKEFRYESERTRHELSHDPHFQCEICTKKFSFLSALRRHQKQHERTGKVECTKCHRKFRDETLLKRHNRYAHKGTFTCKKCNAEFHSELALSTHDKTHNAKSERKYHCNYKGCGKTFNFPHHLKHHELTHTNTKQHYCPVCKKGFIQSHHLKSHMRTHEPERLLCCTVINCKKKFSSECARKKHLSTHNIELDSTMAPVDSNREIVNSQDTVHDDTILCTSCGDIIAGALYTEHQSKCLSIECRPEDACPASTEVNKEIATNKPKIVTNSMLENVPEIKDCQAILGGCIVNRDSEDCICAQIKTSVDIQYEDMIMPIENISPISEQTKQYDYDDYKATEVFEGKNCGNCACGNMNLNTKCADKSDVTTLNTANGNQHNNNITTCNRSDLPVIEYKMDGSIKLRDTFDDDINVHSLSNVENNKERNEVNFSNFVPLNSCKAVLGNCIVSGNGTISEECLCAKMLAEDQQVTEQEIDEITPQPNNHLKSSYLLSFT